MIPRPEIQALLDKASACRLTMVCAGPGWGKTVAVSAWLAARPATAGPMAWVTVSPNSNDPGSFWDAVLGALRSSVAHPDDRPLEELSASGGISDTVLSSWMKGLESLPSEVLLVLDDFQEVTDPQVLESVAQLAEHSTRIRLIILTRVAPALPSHRLRLAGGLAELTATDLAFTPDEVIALGRLRSLAVSPSQAEQLVARTEGWAVGVRLALLHAERFGTGSLASFAGSARSVAEYLIAEVWPTTPRRRATSCCAPAWRGRCAPTWLPRSCPRRPANESWRCWSSATSS